MGDLLEPWAKVSEECLACVDGSRLGMAHIVMSSRELPCLHQTMKELRKQLIDLAEHYASVEMGYTEEYVKDQLQEAFYLSLKGKTPNGNHSDMLCEFWELCEKIWNPAFGG